MSEVELNVYLLNSLCNSTVSQFYQLYILGMLSNSRPHSLCEKPYVIVYTVFVVYRLTLQIHLS